MDILASTILTPLLDSEGKIKVPGNRVKLDIGLSYNAPNSEAWLKKFNDMTVFGFEPNTFSVQEIKAGKVLFDHHDYKNSMDPSRIGNTFFLLECAVTDDEPKIVNFYNTDSDPGTSSLYRPNYFGLREVTEVATIRLSDFFEVFPWDKIPHIEHIKIDTQGNDFKVIKSAGNYLKERVVFVDAEITTHGQYEYGMDFDEMHRYMISQDFYLISRNGSDASYVNLNYKDLSKTLDNSVLPS